MVKNTLSRQPEEGQWGAETSKEKKHGSAQSTLETEGSKRLQSPRDPNPKRFRRVLLLGLHTQCQLDRRRGEPDLCT